MQEQKKDEVLSLKEAWKLSARGFWLIYRHDPQLLLSRLISAGWEGLVPYVGIYLSALIIEELSGNREPEQLRHLVLMTLGLSALMALVSALLAKWKAVHNAGEWHKMEKILSEKLLEMDFVSLDDNRTHELHTSIREHQNSNGWGLMCVIDMYENFFSSVATIAGGAALTVSLFASRVPESAGACRILNHPLCAVLVIAVMLAVTYLAPVFGNKAQSYFAIYTDKMMLGNREFTFYGCLGQNRENAADMRIYRQDILCDKFVCNKEAVFFSKGFFARKSRGPIGLYKAASAGVSVIFTGFAYAFVCIKAWAGAFGLGAAVQYIASITKVAGGVSYFIANMGYMRYNGVFLRQVFEFLDIPNTMYQGSLTVEKRSDRDYEVEFRDVSFKYPGMETYALRHVSMKFKIGERLAVVGMNGSGKTTFIKLLCRLYDPTEGEILLNGINIRKYNYQDYMMIFSVVFQDFKLFALKLGQNIAGQTVYDEARVKACLEKAGFGGRLKTLKDGAETYLYKDFNKDGILVSGGEAQKLAIARALYKDAPFIILDEPTAALDPITEAEIYARLDEIVEDRTAIYISHRLSSCKFCDEILVFHEGNMIQQGSHETLVADEQGKYYELWHAQAQYYA